MRQFSEYKTIIFDCDGVIFDSNNLKISAMRNALLDSNIPEVTTKKCVEFFSNNFGLSRFYHIDLFVNQFIDVSGRSKGILKQQLLELYSTQCSNLYLEAETTPAIETLLKESKSKKYVASGSEQNELINIFEKRNLKQYFKNIYGSPTKKSTLVSKCIDESEETPCVMIGDAQSDFEAASQNNIDFIYYSPFSNVDLIMRELSKNQKFRVLDSFNEILIEL